MLIEGKDNSIKFVATTDVDIFNLGQIYQKVGVASLCINLGQKDVKVTNSITVDVSKVIKLLID